MRRRLHTSLAAQLVVGLAVAIGTVGAAETSSRRPGRVSPAMGKPMPPAGGQQGAAPGTRIDPAVTQAGGHVGDCGHCRRSACPQCRLPDADHGPMHGPCQHGLCPAHCPVRPDVFGFYGTQWRKWPGSGVVQASSRDEATPARPPKAEVPQPAEESLQPPPGSEPPPGRRDDGAAGGGDDSGDGAMNAAEESPAADTGKVGKDRAAREPLPRPFPEVDDGATLLPQPTRRVRRVIPIGGHSGARLVNGVEEDPVVDSVAEIADGPGDARAAGGRAPAGDGRAPVVESADVGASGGADEKTVTRSSPWRRVLAADTEDGTTAVGR